MSNDNKRPFVIDVKDRPEFADAFPGGLLKRNVIVPGLPGEVNLIRDEKGTTVIRIEGSYLIAGCTRLGEIVGLIYRCKFGLALGMLLMLVAHDVWARLRGKPTWTWGDAP